MPPNNQRDLYDVVPSLVLPNTKWLLKPAPIRNPVAIGGYAPEASTFFSHPIL